MLKPSNHNGDGDFEVGTAVGAPSLLPEGDHYIVGFRRAEQGTFCGAVRIFLWFQIVEPIEHAEKELYLCCPVPSSLKFGIGSKFVDAWRIAAGQWPMRRDRLSTKIFRGKYFRASIRSVTRSQHGDERPVEQHYSKVERLIERVTG
ncbi:MAG: hypothetical protein NTX84_03295 [Nitrospirae bacterium]|nr:hypothetical protein [Nitrospirota bacterium]